MRKAWGACTLLMLLLCGAPRAEPLSVASKLFTESVLLGEIATRLLDDAGQAATHRRELGGTRILWSALLRGDIDCYPEYTGTLRAEILAAESLRDDAQLREALRRHGVWSSAPLGFNNTYVLGMARQRAQMLAITRISDLARHPQLRYGFSNEFLQRADGWPGLRDRYQLNASPRGLNHDLAYRGIATGDLDVIDLYSTDAEIAYYDLLALEDDAKFFPDYHALYVCRADAPPAALAALNQLSGRISDATMLQLNARAKLDRVPDGEVAADFLRNELGIDSATSSAATRGERVWLRTREHLGMVGISLFAAIIIAVPLGVLAFYRPRFGRAAFLIASIVQTIPALALLVFLIPGFGIGYEPAIIALFLYALLPILRNTHTGLADIPLDIRESAQALGLSLSARLRYVELPLASRSILGGIKTAAVISVGTATLGALIGAGGYGQPILTGIRLDDMPLILEGAIPAAALALLVQGLFELFERLWIKGR